MFRPECLAAGSDVHLVDVAACPVGGAHDGGRPDPADRRLASSQARNVAWHRAVNRIRLRVRATRRDGRTIGRDDPWADAFRRDRPRLTPPLPRYSLVRWPDSNAEKLFRLPSGSHRAVGVAQTIVRQPLGGTGTWE